MRRWTFCLRIILVAMILLTAMTMPASDSTTSTVAAQSENISSYEMQAEMTAYTPYDEGCTGIAYDGNPAIPYRTIAVDPDVIPLGSLVRIIQVTDHIPNSSDELFVAHDVGGAIVGQRIDVCVRSVQEAYRFGRRNMRVIVYPPEENNEGTDERHEGPTNQ